MAAVKNHAHRDDDGQRPSTRHHPVKLGLCRQRFCAQTREIVPDERGGKEHGHKAARRRHARYPPQPIARIGQQPATSADTTTAIQLTGPINFPLCIAGSPQLALSANLV
jgi:hypothetical protein